MFMHAMLLAAVLAADGERPKVAVMELQSAGAPKEAATALSEAITQEISRRGFLDVISSRDIETLLGVERQKQLLGCSDTSCTTELAGALGTRFVLSGTLSKLGETYQLSLQMLEPARAQTVARGVRLGKDIESLVRQLPWVIAEATATPLPAAPSKVLPISLLSVGGAALATSLVLTIDGVSRYSALTSELSSSAGVYKTKAAYQAEIDSIGVSRTVAIITGSAGALLVAAGLVVYPAEGTSVALLPTSNGFAFAGAFP
jgi:TolB-like protein